MSRRADSRSDVPAFKPVASRARHDGWTPSKQHDFIQALAESGCVAEACAAVAMTTRSAYRLRARADASAFRQSWDIALDFAIRRLSDAAFSRALNGVANPIFFQGEQVGERRHFDERLTMFLLKYRDPTRYGSWLDATEARRHPDGAAIVLAQALNTLLDDAHELRALVARTIAARDSNPDEPGEAGDESGNEAPDDDDDQQPAGLPRALELGRCPIEDAVAAAPDDPLARLTAIVRARVEEVRARAADPDGREAGWQGALITRTPRKRPKVPPKVPPT